MNTNEPKRVKTCRCGQEFEYTDGRQRSCPKCVAERETYQAKHPRPLRTCKECGAESRETHRGLCPTCEAERSAKAKTERKKWEQERRKRQQSDENQHLRAWFRSASDEARMVVLAWLEQGAGELGIALPKDTDIETRIIKITEALVLYAYAQATPDQQAARRADWIRRGRHNRLAMVGYPMPEPEPVDPEQVAHEEQDRIDDVAADLLEDIDI